MIEIMPLLDLAKKKMTLDLDSGELRWRAGFRGCKEGKLVGNRRPEEHIMIGLDGKLIYAHRLVWAWLYNEEPPAEIDHIDRDKHNNALSNLRDGTGSVNDINRGLQRNNKTGVSGVSIAGGGCFHARSGERSTLYYGDNLFEAICARKSWEASYWRAAA